MHIVLLLCWILVANSAAGEFRIGVASVDISPAYPIRLSGYAVRTNASASVAAPLFAKALAIEQKEGQPALMLTIDNCGISREIWQKIVASIEKKHGLPAERIVIFSSHTHSAPVLTDVIANLFVAPLPKNEQATVDRYTRELVAAVDNVATKALAKLEPGTLHFAQGAARFAKNRRTEGGPVDHSVPILAAKKVNGDLIAVLANYACHCTTLGGEFNQSHPDWAGIAQTIVQEKHPGALCLVSIGCGADANPHPRGSLDRATAHGAELAAEIQRLLGGEMERISGEAVFQARALDLPFDPLPSREEWTQRAAQGGIVGYHARRNLERLDRGEKLPTTLPYQVQVWSFGDDLGMVFLPGEVVVDYALRLKSLFDPARLWVSGYANWVPCYIPSERILREGGYEAEHSLWYYDRPARLSKRTENDIISTAQALLPSVLRNQPAASE